MKGYEQARGEILDWLAQTLQIPVEEIDLHKPLTEIGLDSLDAVHMIATIESIIGRELPEDIIQRVSCLEDVFDMMRERMAAA
ncbi:MAG: acyl carrier protein [Planctomycetota bacterium]|nr:MAG: acyl carrier protein [Planctomycetota bacterium]